MAHGGIPEAATVSRLMAMIGDPPKGYCYCVQYVIPGQIDVYVVNEWAAHSPGAMPEGARLVGIARNP